MFSGEMHCALMCNTTMHCQNRPSIIKAVIIDATRLSCALPRFQKSSKFRITAIASVADGRLSELQKLPSSSWLEIEVFAPTPQPISANFTKGLQEIVIVFDQNIKLEATSCTPIFDKATLGKIGQPSTCSQKGLNTLVVALGLDATISPGDALSFNRLAVSSRGEAIQDNRRTSVIVKPAAQSEPLRVHLIGPTSIGNCDTLPMKVSAYGSTGRGSLRFNWTVKFSTSTNQASLIQSDRVDLAWVTTYLASLPRETPKVVLGSNHLKASSNVKKISYEFSVTATNYLSQTSNAATLLVERKSANVPMVKILGGTCFDSLVYCSVKLIVREVGS